jgi:NAD+ synthase (glutamine-hydrolysing)
MVVFPELTITGYPPKDLLYDESFVDKAIEKIEQIAQAFSKEEIIIVVGGVRKAEFQMGRANLYNCAYVIREGRINYRDKMLLPNYTVFDERRYFIPADNNISFCCEEKDDFEFQVTICEDIWKENYDEEIYFSTSDNLHINISSSPFSVTKIEQRKAVLQKRYEEIGCPILYVNQVGGQDDLVFDGCSMYCDKGGAIQIGKSFEEDFVIIDTEDEGLPDIEEMSEEDKVHDALVVGVRDYFHKSGFKKALIGLSGGIDSALVAVVAQRALGADNITCVLMPSKYSSKHSVDDAYALAKNLGVNTVYVPIHEIHESTYREVQGSWFGNHTEQFKGLTDQNMQARIRGQILMSLSNETGALVLSTGNKSECAVGYCTLYGDMCGGLNVLGDVYKTTVFKVCEYINKDEEIIPRNILTKPPSAELAPDQKDSNELPEYDELDEILKLHIEECLSVNRVVRMLGEDKREVIEKIIKRVRNNEYKRRQSAPMIIVSDRDLLNGRRIPIVNGWY